MRGSILGLDVAIAMCLALALLSTTGAAASGKPASAGQTRTLVVGGIQPCSGLPPSMVHGLARYAAGTVVVLAGLMTWGPRRNRIRYLIFPKHEVARETVKVNRMYRFALRPGRYVLTARLPRSNVRPFVQIVVTVGRTMHVDIPNMCK